MLSLYTGCASAILTPRIINGIFEAQDLLAQRIIGHGREDNVAKADSRKHRIEMLKLDAVVLLLIVAAATALFPSLPSRVVADVFHS